jgi:hypothetical protein
VLVSSKAAHSVNMPVNFPPTSLLGQALAYLDVEGPRRVARGENITFPFTLRRKKWLFSQSVKRAKASAALDSVIGFARLNRLKPSRYLQLLFKQLPGCQSVESFEQLLPWHLDKNQFNPSAICVPDAPYRCFTQLPVRAAPFVLRKVG